MLIFDQLKRNDPPLRLLALVVLCSLLMLLVGLWWVQVVRAEHYAAKLETQSFRTVRIPAMRGQILDRNGIPLAENRPSYNVSLYLEELRKEFKRQYQENLTAFRAEHQRRANRAERDMLERHSRYQVTSNLVTQAGFRLQATAALDPSTFHRHYETRRALPVPVLMNLDAAQIARFQERPALPALDMEVHPVRVYPFTTTAAHLLGYVRRDDSSAEGEEAFFNHRLPDFRGYVGIEAAFDPQLRGRAGVKSVLVNNLGYRQSENIWAAAEPGWNVVLTIDLPIQQAAERALQRFGPTTRGAVVVMDARTGDVLALVSAPAFNPNQFVQGMTHAEWARLNDPKLRPQINRAIQENYAPGSIFKTIVGLACLEAGLNPKEQIHNPGNIYVGRRFIRDLAPAGHYDFRRALKLSSNTYFITNGLKAGIEAIAKLGQRLHLGERTGLPTRQEVSGIFPSLKRVGANWFNGDTANICLGQGPMAVTPLQMAVMTAAIANGGKVFWPRIVERLEPQDPADGRQALLYPSGRVRDHLGVRPDSLEVLREAMLADVEDADATGRAAAVPGMRVCGKTGTAQVMNERNQVVDHTAWFVSFAPYGNPGYVVVVMVESGGSGGTTCAPIARDIYLAIQKREQMSHRAETLAEAK